MTDQQVEYDHTEARLTHSPGVQRFAVAQCSQDKTWEHHDQTDGHPCTRCLLSSLEWVLLTVMRQHYYKVQERTATKPDDPGWHACTCGWEGYWSDYQPHVAAEQIKHVISPGQTGEVS